MWVYIYGTSYYYMHENTLTVKLIKSKNKSLFKSMYENNF